MHILSPETDNCPSWISGRERMTIENISWSISMKECCRPRQGLNPRPPGLQSDGASNWATEAGTSAMRWSTMQGLVVVGLIFEEIPNINVKCVKVNWSAKYRSRYPPSQYIEKKHYTRFGGWRLYSWGHIEGRPQRCKSQWSAKYTCRPKS